MMNGSGYRQMTLTPGLTLLLEQYGKSFLREMGIVR